MEADDDGKWNQRYVENTLKDYAKIAVSLEHYCKISSLALEAPIEYILICEATYKSEIKKGANYENLVGFLLNPNIDLMPRTKHDGKEEENIKEVGRRVFATLSYAWDYYIRMLKGFQAQQKQMPMVYNKENVKLGKENLLNMLKELKDRRYWWENFDKNDFSFQEEEIKEVRQEQTFIKLLDNMLKNQIQKVIAARVKESHEQAGNRAPQQQQRQSPNQVKQTDIYGRQSLMDLRGYFQMKRKEGKGKKPQDLISQCQERRRFNAAVLRYCSDSRIY